MKYWCQYEDAHDDGKKERIKPALPVSGGTRWFAQSETQQKTIQDIKSGREKIAVFLHEILGALVPALLSVMLLFLFVLRILGIDGHSMLPGLQDGDFVLVRSSLFYTPQRGDIVVLRKENFLEDPIVKRVIATEGQVVDINFVSGTVSVDSAALDEPYIKGRTHLKEDVSFPTKVEEGCVFVMGDNRNKSTDSRDSRVGMVDTRYIIGKVVFIVAPPGRMGGIQ